MTDSFMRTVLPSNTVTYYLPDGLAVSVAGGAFKYYTYFMGGGERVAADTGKVGSLKSQYYLNDYQNSIGLVVNDSAVVVEAVGYDTFGKPRNMNGTADPTCAASANAKFGYINQENLPDLCLIDLNARYYDPALARFMAPDPIVGDASDSQAWNAYTYSRNNPMSKDDPTGLWASGCLCVSSGVEVLGDVDAASAEGSAIENAMKSAADYSNWVSQSVAQAQQRAINENAAVHASPAATTMAFAMSSLGTIAGTVAQFAIDAGGTAAVGAGVAVTDGADAALAPEQEEGVLAGGQAAKALVKGLIDGKGAAEEAAEATTVIGRVKDLQQLQKGEQSLLDRLPNLGSPKANWAQNSGVLRQEMSRGVPIRDASPGDTGGQFLNAERNLLRDRGWTFDSQTNYWTPPKP